MALNINISEIFYKAFGYEMPEPEQPEIPDAPTRTEYSSLGASYYDWDDWGREHYLPVTLNGYMIPFAVLSILPKKMVVKTPMPERGGSVHELVSIDDYVINIKGLFINDDNTFPESDIQVFQNIFLINQSIKLRSVITDIFLSGKFDHSVVVTDMKWNQIAGTEHAISFEMACESDMAFELEIQ